MMHGLNAKAPVIALLGLLVAWLGLAAPGLSDQYQKLARARGSLADRSLNERARLLDHPAFSLAQQVSEAVPADACAVLAAYAGPAAVDYYRARLAYLLYPRRIQVLADSAAALGDCGYFVVFRDTEQNLAAEPFAGSWNQQDLERRLASLETVAVTSLARIYRTP
jgi:hypothetical protein